MAFISKSVPAVDSINPVQGRATLTTDNVFVDVLAAPGGGYQTVVTDILVAHAAATPTWIRVRFRDGDNALTDVAVLAGTTITISLVTPLVLSINQPLRASVSGNVTSVFVTASGFLVRRG